MYIRIGLLVGFASAVAWGTSAAVVGYYKPIVAELETRVKTANALAEAQNREIEIKNQLLLTRAKQYATDLDLAYEKSKKIIDVHRGQLDAISKRVLDHSGARCPSTRLSDTNGSSSGSAEDPAPNFTIVSKEFIRQLTTDALRADKVGAFADLCSTFVNNNCGITDHGKL